MYKFGNGYCREAVGNDDLYGSKEEQQEHEGSYHRIFNGIKLVNKTHNIEFNCKEVYLESTCRANFPKCDKTYEKPFPRPLCKETCEYGMKLCHEYAAMVRRFNKLRDNLPTPYKYPLYWVIPDCKPLKFRNGGEAPECYFSRRLNSKLCSLLHHICKYSLASRINNDQ